MSSSALESQGMLFQRAADGSPTVYQTIPEVKTFSGPSGSASVIDTTDLSSTSKEKRLGLADSGQIQLTINYIPTNAVHALLRADWVSGDIRGFKMVYTDSGVTEHLFQGFVSGFAISGGVDGVVEASVTIEISGSITEVL